MADANVAFDRDAFIRGITTAMTIGLPNEPENMLTFYFGNVVVNTAPADTDGVPFSVTAVPTTTPVKPPVQVPCAIEYDDGSGRLENVSEVIPSKAVLTFLAEDYAKVEGFQAVVMGGIVYRYSHVETPLAMATVDVWMVHVVSDDQT